MKKYKLIAYIALGLMIAGCKKSSVSIENNPKPEFISISIDGNTSNTVRVTN